MIGLTLEALLGGVAIRFFERQGDFEIPRGLRMADGREEMDLPRQLSA
jgi:hypothetical protein